jgi:hypothetical protein
MMHVLSVSTWKTGTHTLYSVPEAFGDVQTNSMDPANATGLTSKIVQNNVNMYSAV